MVDLPDLIAKLSVLRFKDESTPEAVGENRMKLLQLLAAIFPDSITQMWLAEESKGQLNLLLGYVHPRNESFSATTLYGIRQRVKFAETSETFFLANRDVMDSKVRRAYQKLNLNVESIHHYIIENVLSKPTPQELAPLHASNIIGWGSIGFHQKRELNPIERSAVTLIGNRLGALVEQGRLNRLFELTKRCEAALSSSLSGEEAVNRVIELLARSSGARWGSKYVVRGQSLTRAPAATVEGESREEKALDCWLKNTFKVNPNCRRHLIRNKLKSGRIREWPTSILSVPIALDGRRLIPHGFRFLSSANESVVRVRVVVFCLFLCGKLPSDWLGGWFTETELRMAESVCRQLSAFLRSRAFQHVHAEFFESLDRNEDRLYALCKKHLVSTTPLVADMDIVQVGRPDKRDTWMRNGTESIGAISDHVIDDLKNHVGRSSDDEEGEDNETISVCVTASAHKTTKAELHVLFHMPTKYTLHRYVIISLTTDLIDEISFESIVHFIKELHFFFRAQDAIRERGSMLAQIRHAVIAPLSAVALNLDTFQTEFDRCIRSSAAWDALKRDVEFRDFIPSAIGLVNQALLIAQTGRYLLSTAQSDDLKIQHYNIVDLVNKIRKAFIWQINERRLTFKLIVRGGYRGIMTGDETMLWMVISNLLDNAIKFAYMRTEVIVIITLRVSDYRFEIKNTGVHLSADERPRVFRPFIRGLQDDTLNRRPGTGLGLPVARMLLRAHSERANLEFNSKRLESHGAAQTVFSFEMPYMIGKRYE
jgi:signal transduction histidine kinase